MIGRFAIVVRRCYASKYLANRILTLRISTAAVGVFLLVEQGIRLAKTLPNNSLILMVFILLPVLISWSWKVISGNTTRVLLLSFQPPTIVIAAETKPPLWKWTIQSIRAARKLFTIIANSHNLTLRLGMKIGTKVLEHLTTFCNPYFEQQSNAQKLLKGNIIMIIWTARVTR